MGRIFSSLGLATFYTIDSNRNDPAGVRRCQRRCLVQYARNAFLGRHETIANLRWDPQLNTYEHWELLCRASQL